MNWIGVNSESSGRPRYTIEDTRRGLANTFEDFESQVPVVDNTIFIA